MRVLVADDDATSRLLLQTIVSKLGHECLVANDGSTAWELLAKEGIDVLLSDWLMPGLDGPELCRRVRDELGEHYVYVVLVTRLDDPEQVLVGMRAGADDYLIKPVDPFAVQTRMVAAERVIALHRQLGDVRTELELVNIELLEQSLTDTLTGLGNRRRLEEDIEHTHARGIRVGRPHGVALFDIDHFKLYNDHYGHLAGDETLRRVARCLDDATRADERVYRYGGEEFLLLLSECGLDRATLAAERILRAVADLAIPHDARPTAPPIVTLSAGVSCWTPGSSVSVAELLTYADGALYRAKSAGRNRVQSTTNRDGRERETARHLVLLARDQDRV